MLNLPADFTVNLAALGHGKERIAMYAKDIRAVVEQIDTLMQGVAANWGGPAGTAFAALQVAGSADMATMVDVLDQMVARLESAYDKYELMEQQNVKNLA